MGDANVAKRPETRDAEGREEAVVLKICIL